MDTDRNIVTEIEFIGGVTFETGTIFEETEIGGLSGITYNPFLDVYYAVSDTSTNPRFYTLNIDVTDGALDDGDVDFIEVTSLVNLDENGVPIEGAIVDPEGITFLSDDTLFISSEGDVDNGIDPFINQFSLEGEQFSELTIPDRFLIGDDPNSGIRDNLVFESLTVTPDEKFLFTALEAALIQDGPIPTLEDESASRIIQFDLTTGEEVGEFIYFTDPIPNAPIPPDSFADNGLVELVATDNTGTLLALERSFAVGVGNSIRLYEVNLQGATNVIDVDSIAVDPANPNDGLLDIDEIASKELILDFADLGIGLDNSEAISFGPELPDGRQSFFVVSDNNFNDVQTTQFLGFALDLDTIPGISPVVETPEILDTEDAVDSSVGEASDPAIWVHPTNSGDSLVINALEEGGLQVTNLDGEASQLITPDSVSYNGVDIVYGFELAGEIIDLAVVTDGENDSLAIFEIDPDTLSLTDITAPSLSASDASIFGVDDGEETAASIASYVSLVDDSSFVFVSQEDGDTIAQLELIDNGAGAVDANVVRNIDLPTPAAGELENPEVGGLVVDRELGLLYASQEEFGILRFAAEPNGGEEAEIIATVDDFNPDSPFSGGVQGLTIYYGADTEGYLIASDEEDSTFAVYDRSGSNSFLGSFSIGAGETIDGVENSEGLDIINVPLGEQFPSGLLVVQDDSNEPALVEVDLEDGEIENVNSNFKYVDLEDLAEPLNFFDLDTTSFDPRNPTPNSLINGIASGDTTQTSTVLWARSLFLGDLTFEFSTDPEFNTIDGTITETVVDALIPIKVEINDLIPDTEYFYQVTDAGGDVETGTFETSAELGTFGGLTFGVSGDWRGELGPYPAISNAPGENLEFFIQHGDTIYADFDSDAVLDENGIRVEQVETLDQYRAKHGEVYGARLGINAWAELRASTSILATIDDHEVINDFSGGASADTDPRFPETTGFINDTELFDNGLDTFQEFNPLRDEFYGDTGDDRTAFERELYRFNTYGSDAAVFILDNRSFRDAPIEEADLTDPADVTRFLTESFTLDRTLLGQVQLDDLFEDLLEAEASGITWKFLLTPEPIQNFGPGAAADRFEGYAEERTQILSFIDENDIDNVVFIAADVHGTVVNNLTYQETLGGPQIPLNAFEVTTGSVAFDPPFADATVEFAAAFGLLSPEEVAFFESLPSAPDADDIIDDQDDFFANLINTTGLAPFGLDPVGLDDNLDIAEGLIDAELLQGDYVAATTFGWTEFDISPVTGDLTVTTYGVEPYSEEEILSNPELALQEPAIVSQFVVSPAAVDVVDGADGIVFGTSDGDTFDAANPDDGFDGDGDFVFTGVGDDSVNSSSAIGGNNRIYTGSDLDELIVGSDDRAFGGEGDDTLDASSGTGGNRLYGAEGNDELSVLSNDRAFGGEGDDILDASGGTGGNRLYGGEGEDNFLLGTDDRIVGNDGDDTFVVGTGGDNLITGGEGADIFTVVSDSIPDSANTITDLEIDSDTIGIIGFGATPNLTFGSDTDGNATLSLDGSLVAIFTGISEGELATANFDFTA